MRFKFYIKEKESWLPAEESEFEEDYPYYPYMIGPDGKIITIDFVNDIFFRQENAVACLSTGLKDKNGVEIFEGDIVLTNNCINFRTVKFGLCCYAMQFYLERGEELPVTLSVADHIEYEIIGNIYQKPELMEDQ